MITYLNEVPGARERPGGCPIEIETDGDQITVTLPPRGVSPVIFFFACILFGNLLTALYTGLMLLLANKSVLAMAQIAPNGLPVSLRHDVGFLLVALLLAEALGLFTLAAILSPIFYHEKLVFAAKWIHIFRSKWGRTQELKLVRADVRGFHIRRVPPGLDAGVLTIQARGEEVEIGEFLREIDREWLASVGNTLL
ncbi:MAG: hypothetical protein ACRYFS_26395 [Janthinobacterium lividum]